MLALAAMATLGSGLGIYFVLTTRRKTWIIVELLLLVVPVLVWLLASRSENPAISQSAGRWLSCLVFQNLALTAFSLTRCFDRAGYARAIQLGAELGVDAETVEELL